MQLLFFIWTFILHLDTIGTLDLTKILTCIAESGWQRTCPKILPNATHLVCKWRTQNWFTCNGQTRAKYKRKTNEQTDRSTHLCSLGRLHRHPTAIRSNPPTILCEFPTIYLEVPLLIATLHDFNKLQSSTTIVAPLLGRRMSQWHKPRPPHPPMDDRTRPMFNRTRALRGNGRSH